MKGDYEATQRQIESTSNMTPFHLRLGCGRDPDRMALSAAAIRRGVAHGGVG
jgi:hypothetical protein